MDKIYFYMKMYIKALFMFPLSILVFSAFIVYGFFAYAILAIISLFFPSLLYVFLKHSLTMSLAVDQLANASIHGNEDQTISGRLGYAIHYKGKENIIYVILCQILNKFFKQSNHCLDAIEFDRVDID